MAQTLTVWKFNTPEGAQQASETLQRLATTQVITVHDAATVSWEEGKKKPKTQQLTPTTASGALGGSFWGLLFGLIFFVPLLGAAVGAAIGALTGSLADVGIDDSFINAVKEQVTPGISALFLLTSDAVLDRIRQEIPESHAKLIASNLSAEQEAKLREAFSEE